MYPVHNVDLAESMVSERIRKMLKCAVVYFYKGFFIIQGQKYIKIDTFISVFTFPYFILNTIAFESKGHGFSLGRLWVKCIP